MAANGCRLLVFAAIVSAFTIATRATAVQVLPPGNSEVEQHTEIRLVCRVPDGTESVTWYRGQDLVVPDASKEISADFETSSGSAQSQTRDHVLKIAEAEETDAGVYSCSAGNHKSENNVSIAIAESHHHVTATSSHVMLTPGSPLTLTCDADIHTTITWYKDQQLAMNIGGDVTVSVTDDKASHKRTSKLVLGTTTVDSVGKYRCVNNHHDDDRAEIVVSLTAASGSVMHFVNYAATLLCLTALLILY